MSGRISNTFLGMTRPTRPLIGSLDLMPEVNQSNQNRQRLSANQGGRRWAIGFTTMGEKLAGRHVGVYDYGVGILHYDYHYGLDVQFTRR